ncbi:multicopper oxidase mco-like isoform X2 [Styela clava]
MIEAIAMRKLIIFITISGLLQPAVNGECPHCSALKGRGNFKDCRTYDTSVIRRSGNTLFVNLIVDIAEITIEWLSIKRRVYNGNLCGPTIQVKPGDTVKLSLHNRLGADQAEGIHNQLRLPNTTNIHLHGLHISPDTPGDNVFTRVDPGFTVGYTYAINQNQPPGTYWYHAHWHGSTWFQVMSGLSGLLIVDDEPNTMAVQLNDVSCPDHCEHDIHVLLQSTLQYSDNSDGVSFIWNIQRKIGDTEYFRLNDSVEQWLMDVNNGFDYYTTNGLYNPVLKVQKNQMKRFRIVNAGGYVGLELEVININGSGDCVIREIAFDGVYLDAPRVQIAGQSYITVGGRVDWMIYCNGVGFFQLRSVSRPESEYSIGTFRRYNGDLMIIEVMNSDLPTPTFPADLPDRPEFVKDLLNVTDIPESNKFVVEFSDDFFMNREKFDVEKDYRFRMKVGSIQEWTFVNTIPGAPHPLHIHVNHFQIISYNDYTGPLSGKSQYYFNEFPTFVLRSQSGNLCNDSYGIPNLQYEDPYRKWPNQPDEKFLAHKKRWLNLESGGDDSDAVGYSRKGDWRDVLNLPPFSNVTVRFNVHEYTGSVVLHCHVLKHEDLGMMITVESVDDINSQSNIGVRELGCREIIGNSGAQCEGYCVATWVLVALIIAVILLSIIAFKCCRN